MSDDRQAVEAAAQLYLDGLYEGDTEKLGAVFLPTCALTYEADGEIQIIPSRAAWFELVRGRPSAQSQGQARHDEILTVDQSSPTTAFVKLRCALPPRFFVDYLSFLKIDGRWQVAQKVFAVRTEPDRA